MAMGEEQLLKLMHSHDYELMNAFHEKLKDLLRQYYYVGGMPEVVKAFVENKLLNQVRSLQNEILSNYASDFSKHAPSLHHYLMDHPDISAIRYSMLPYRQQANITNMPLYGVFLK